jgi:hypothetical protein
MRTLVLHYVESQLALYIPESRLEPHQLRQPGRRRTGDDLHLRESFCSLRLVMQLSMMRSVRTRREFVHPLPESLTDTHAVSINKLTASVSICVTSDFRKADYRADRCHSKYEALFFIGTNRLIRCRAQRIRLLQASWPSRCMWPAILITNSPLMIRLTECQQCRLLGTHPHVV